MKPTPLHSLRPARRLFREPYPWGDLLRAIATVALCVAIAWMLGVGCVPTE